MERLQYVDITVAMETLSDAGQTGFQLIPTLMFSITWGAFQILMRCLCITGHSILSKAVHVLPWLVKERYRSDVPLLSYLTKPLLCDTCHCVISYHGIFNISRSRQDGPNFPDDIFQCIFLNEMYEFWLGFHWNVFLTVQLTVFQHWFR